MLNPLRIIIATAAVFTLVAPSSAETDFVPTIHDPNVASVTLFAENPDIVTPIGVAVAPDGRVFVQENHTHKRTSNYDGPATDRILIFEDTNNDGVADQRSVFYEGHTFSTDLLFGPDGHLYVSTRWFVGRFLNAATATKADGEPEKVIECQTGGDYPHNGVGGLAIDPANPEWLAFGFGENLGAPYTFVGTDGTNISGGNEGGSTYLCRTDGSELQRQSTGHWNAFGMAFDTHGNLFSTDNDPNAMPPNRLLHVIPGADFGYEYRYGRSGQHPLVCWNGEIPGTLGMIGPLGEAACGVTPFGEGRLLTASWTDNRVDVHELKPNGASFTATRDPLLSGPNEFRPVHFAYALDGRFLYITDWVKIDYPVHGHGRIWRVEFKKPIDNRPSERTASPNRTTAEAIANLGDPDPYIRTAAIHTLVQSPQALVSHKIETESNPIARAHFAVARKRLEPTAHAELIPQLLADPDERVRFVAIKWIGDERLSQYRDALQALLQNDAISGASLKAVFAAMARFNSDDNKEFSPSRQMLDLAFDEQRPSDLRAVALRNVTIDDAAKHVAKLAELTRSNNAALQREAVQTLVMLSSPQAVAALGNVAMNGDVVPSIRADAIAGLASLASQFEDELRTLANHEDQQIANEAQRTLVAAQLTPRPLVPKPAATDLASWETLLDQVPGSPDLNVGRRLFFHSKLAACYKCHAIHGRGHNIGPDLTTINRQSNIDRRWLLRHIIDPSAEVAPYYRPQLIITVDGEAKTGFIVGREGKRQGYLAANGELFYVDKSDIEDRREMKTSIMPTGLLDKLTPSEIRDLIGYLLADAES